MARRQAGAGGVALWANGLVENRQGELQGEAQMRKGDVTVFKVVGVGLQDLAIAQHVVSKAESLANWVVLREKLIQKCDPGIVENIL